jgi:hypothetical protein
MLGMLSHLSWPRLWGQGFCLTWGQGFCLMTVGRLHRWPSLWRHPPPLTTTAATDARREKAKERSNDTDRPGAALGQALRLPLSPLPPALTSKPRAMDQLSEQEDSALDAHCRLPTSPASRIAVVKLRALPPDRQAQCITSFAQSDLPHLVRCALEAVCHCCASRELCVRLTPGWRSLLVGHLSRHAMG